MEISEQFADGQASKDDLKHTWSAAARLAEAALSRLSRWDMLAWTKVEARDAARHGTGRQPTTSLPTRRLPPIAAQNAIFSARYSIASFGQAPLAYSRRQ